MSQTYEMVNASCHEVSDEAATTAPRRSSWRAAARLTPGGRNEDVSKSCRRDYALEGRRLVAVTLAGLGPV